MARAGAGHIPLADFLAHKQWDFPERSAVTPCGGGKISCLAGVRAVSGWERHVFIFG